MKSALNKAIQPIAYAQADFFFAHFNEKLSLRKSNCGDKYKAPSV
jgi:hypothetical protein